MTKDGIYKEGQIEKYTNMWEWEIMDSFLAWYNLTAEWTNCNFTWGWYDEGNETWTGAVKVVISELSFPLIVAP